MALVDVEGSRERRLFVDAAFARRFQEELASYFGHRIGVREPGIDYLRTTTQVPFDEFVLKTLRQVSSVAKFSACCGACHPRFSCSPRRCP